MNKHEEVKQQCAKILNYYYILSHTKSLQDHEEEVDIEGYFMEQYQPDIGIKVDSIPGSFQNDAAKLVKIGSFQLRIIVSQNPDTLSLGPIVNISGKDIHIVPPPDTNISFELLIREFTGQTDKMWYNEFIKQIEKKIGPLSLSDFIGEIHDQELDINVAKDILFQAGLCGIRAGFYKQGAVQTEFHRVIKIPKELLYLSARGLIEEDRLGKNYETGRQSIYNISKKGYDLIGSIMKERVDEKGEVLQKLLDTYNESIVLISLIGKMGRFIYDSYKPEFYDPYTSIPLDTWLTGTISINAPPRSFVEEFNINPAITYTASLVATSPLFEKTLRQVYNALIDAGLGNETEAFSSKGEYIGEMYCVPLSALLRKLNVKKWIISPQMNKLKLYAEWVIVRAHNPTVPNTLYKSFEAIGLAAKDAEVLIGELAKQGITSKPVKGGLNTVAIYEKKHFNDYCEERMENILQDILKDN